MMWAAQDVYIDDEGRVRIGFMLEDEETGRTPDGKVITLTYSTGGTKTENTVSAYINAFQWKLCMMYRDLKAAFGEREAKVS